MTERVQCAECADSYDSDEHPFCPRCGAVATEASPAAAVRLAKRNDPSRRRVQASGVMMVSTGGLVLALGLALLVLAGTLAGTMYDDGIGQESAPLDVRVQQGGLPVIGANITIQAIGAEPVTNVTDADGYARFAMQPDAIVDITVGNWTGRVAVMSLGGEGAYELSLADGTPTSPILDEQLARDGVRIIGAVALFFAVGPLVGGIMALRLRRRTLALVGAIVGGVSWFFLFIATMSLVVLLVLALYVAALVFVQQGRNLFAS